ncbi:MAG: hypothetical protein CM1200mP30_16810 [Pseudomonadota bacterium]|nr:MAG: hypothetical protein CM1200mP30_16810 [Pseudomonadota bacterium]
MAKALGGGLPLGAMLCTEKMAQSFKPEIMERPLEGTLLLQQ